MQLITIDVKQTIMKKESKKIWTIGHSAHSFETFVAMLENFQIEVLADVRRFPGSEKFLQFSKSHFERYLPQNNIKYQTIPLLGGRREPKTESGNKFWQNPSFKGYADYMDSDNFREGIRELSSTANHYKTAIMYAEAVWWRCHRGLISDYLKAEGWIVMHIMGIEQIIEHPYTRAARIINGKLSYSHPVNGDECN